MRKKQKRIRRDAATKAAVIARAQVVGAARAAQELLGSAGLGSTVGLWARRVGAELPKFIYIPKTGEHRRMGGPEAPGLGSGNPEPRQVTMTPPQSKGATRASPTEQNIAIALAIIEGGHPQAVAETFGVTAGHCYQVRQYLAPRIAAERGLEYAPPPKSARTKAPKRSDTLVSSRQLGMYEPPPSEPPLRVNVHPVRDEAETARAQAQGEMLESALRQALRERDAFKLVHEVLMREKDPSR